MNNYEFLPKLKPLDFEGMQFKDRRTQYLCMYDLNRTQTMFKWEGLPDTIPQRNLELYLQTHGNVCITEVNGELYALFGSLGEKLNAYYEPTKYIVTNPWLNFNAQLEIGTECVWGRNDSLGVGLLPMLRYYNSAQTENEQSIYVLQIIARIRSLISADTDITYNSAVEFIKDIKVGKLSPITDSEFFEGLKTSPFGVSGGDNIKDLIELEQYIKASKLNDLGINANYNMKRERLAEPEGELNDDALIPFVEDMLSCRQKICEEVNAMYGTNISVELSGVWLQKEKELEENDITDNENDNIDIEKTTDTEETETAEDAEELSNEVEAEETTEEPSEESEENVSRETTEVAEDIKDIVEEIKDIVEEVAEGEESEESEESEEGEE